MTDGSQTTRKLITERRKAVEAEAEPLRLRLAALDSELRQIDAAISAIDKTADIPGDPALDTIQQGVIRVLSAAPAGLSAAEILNQMRLSRPELIRVSLAPQLSRLKRSGRVKKLQGGVWALDTSW